MGSGRYQARVIFIPNPLMDVRVLSYARSIPRDYMDENEVLQLLMEGVCAQVLEDPDDEFPFSAHEHYDAMIRDMWTPILSCSFDDPESALDKIIDDNVEAFVEMHEIVYGRLIRAYPEVSNSVTVKTHNFTITTVRGAGLWELEGEDDDLQIVFLRSPTTNFGIGYGRSNHHYTQHVS